MQLNRLRRWQQAMRRPRKERTFVFARLQSRSWVGIVYPVWEHVAIKAQQAEDDFYQLNGFEWRVKDMEINSQGIASTPWGFKLFTPLPHRKDWIPWGNKDTGSRLEQQITHALEPFEIKRVIGDRECSLTKCLRS